MLAFAGMILGTTFAVGAAVGLCVGAGLSPPSKPWRARRTPFGKGSTEMYRTHERGVVCRCGHHELSGALPENLGRLTYQLVTGQASIQRLWISPRFPLASNRETP